MLWKHETEVLVVGAGPVGLLSALMLAERGIAASVIDQEAGRGRHHSALVLHAASLELLDEVGVAAPLLLRGAPVDRLAVYDGAGRRGELSLGEPRSGFPPLLVLPRHALEELLEVRLRDRRVPLDWAHRLAELRHDGERVTAAVEKLGVESGGYPIGGHVHVVDKVTQLHPRFVIGADGHASTVRRGLHIDVAPVGPPQAFVVLEHATSLPLGREARVVLDGQTTNILWPLPGGACRWTLELAGGAIPAKEPPVSPGEIAGMVAARAPWFHDPTANPSWAALLKFEPARAERSGRGHAWLVGDSAHVTGAVGIPGLNEGLREAHDLASRLARVLRGGAGPELLERYDAARTAAWRRAPWALPASGDGDLAGEVTRLLPYLAGPDSDVHRLAQELGLALGRTAASEASEASEARAES